MEKNSPGGFLQAHGASLIENGYNIIPIPPKQKGPTINGWSQVQANKRVLDSWLEQGMGTQGIGINTRFTPAVDIDVPDDDFALELQAKAIELWGEAPIRVGQAPKRLLVYRTDNPFRKMTSATYTNEWGERCRIEILCDGQQFVAFHIHKGTGKPYTWVTDETPLNVAAEDLPTFDDSLVQELFDLFESGAKERQWERTKSSLDSRRQMQAGQVDRDDPFAADVTKVDISTAELRARLMMVPGAEEYETWVEVGMSLFHQYDGEDLGRELWHEWSELADNYDPEALDSKWKSFDITEKRRAPLTARRILQLAKDAAETAAAKIAADLRNQFTLASTMEEWQAAVKATRSAEIDFLSRSALVTAASERLQAISGIKPVKAEIKKLLAYEINTKDMPGWCKSWVYDVSDDRFYHLKHKFSVSTQGFNAMNDRHSLTKKDILEGRTMPTSSASVLALNVYKIPSINGRMYAPGRDPVFTYNGERMANTYPEHHVPEVPGMNRPVDKQNIARVQRHFEHLLEDPKEQRDLLDWIAYVVQNPGQRVNYAPLLQGVQGDGKSFFSFLLAAVMGQPNVRMGNAHILEGSFTGWAEGQCVMAIEEIRLVGHNRFDVLNRVKPFITNKVIEIHPKGRNPYNVENTTNYLLFTNYRDAMPLSKNERRFLVLFSRWQTSEDLRDFLEEHPDYYIELYSALEESAGALRGWLLKHELSDSFNPQGNAPMTKAFYHMAEVAQPPEVRAINEVIALGEYPDICDELLNITLLQQIEPDVGTRRHLEKALEIAGFFGLGRMKINGDMVSYYTKYPEKFQSIGRNETMETDTSKVRKWLKENVPPDDDL